MAAAEVRKVFLEQSEGSIKNCIRQAIWEASRAPLELSEKAKHPHPIYTILLAPLRERCSSGEEVQKPIR